METPLDVLTIGHAIVDVLAPTPDGTPAAHGMDKGTMTLVEAEQADALYADLGPATEASGGSAANTAAGVAALGGLAAFVGKVRDDQLGKVFTHDIRAAGVEFTTPAAAGGPGTGRCLIMVTPDAERTMGTYLGAGDHVLPDDLDEAQLKRAQVVYVEGYLCGLPHTEPTIARAAQLTHGAQRRLALSLSDPFWVELHGSDLVGLLDEVDVIFANEAEAVGLLGAADVESAVTELARRCEVVAVTLGAAGSIVASGRTVASVPAHPPSAIVDTTGAGDMYAAGFLYALTHGHDLARCARLGGLAAAEVISHFGARPQTSLTKLAADAGLIG